MIYFLHGGEGEKARAKAHELIDALRKKRPDAELFSLDAETWTAAEMERLMFGTGLFQSNYIIFLNHVLENKEAEDFILSRVKELEESPNILILLEGELTKAAREKIERKASKTQEFSSKAAARKEWNTFALADAFGSRDKKNLWVLFVEAVAEGKAPEELHGILFWQLKSMLQAANASSPAESGLKPFVHAKSLRYAKNFTAEELRQKSSDLVAMYHDSRRGGEDLDIALEKFVLSL